MRKLKNMNIKNMDINNSYNFRNPVRHFVNIEQLDYPTDIFTFDPI